jgi:hypothetical protein
MNEEQTTPGNEEELPGQPLEPGEDITASEAITGVITEPGETYERVSVSSKKNYWLLPVIILIIANLIATFIFYSNDELVNSVMDKEIAKLEEKVEKGEMTEEQFTQAEKFMDPKGAFFVIIGYVGSIAGPFFMLLILSLVYFVVLKIFKKDAAFPKILNVVGLAFIVTSIGNIISIAISVITGTMSGVSPALLMGDSQNGDTVYAILSKLDVFTVWFLFVIATGLVKVNKLEPEKSYSTVFGVWLLYIIVTVFSPWS